VGLLQQLIIAVEKEQRRRVGHAFQLARVGGVLKAEPAHATARQLRLQLCHLLHEAGQMMLQRMQGTRRQLIFVLKHLGGQTQKLRRRNPPYLLPRKQVAHRLAPHIGQ
jgi:hypothetical protein